MTSFELTPAQLAIRLILYFVVFFGATFCSMSALLNSGRSVRSKLSDTKVSFRP